ncbi:Multidrug resistance-associated protein 1 [Hypsibius exemplaris]|uniref:Multidrug resistance-associated protein 1 n=1 Tax=Hypsibius exemplaris TaxID=2072580 RepID=A0A1W0WQE7_HYPEX|nr:Multidrug resistance-associated protein 1 [Hypsibius exemplaris]
MTDEPSTAAFVNGTIYHPFPAGFCRDNFWDSAITWNTNNPDFTECFQQSALVWVPCMFLWLLLPYQAFGGLRSRLKIRKWSWVSVAKTTLSLLLVILAVAEVSYVAHQWNTLGTSSLPDVDLVAPLVKAATFGLSAVYIYLDRRNAEPSSAVLFFFWLLTTISAIVTFRSKIESAQKYGINDPFRFAIHMIYFPAICAQFILSFVADYTRDYKQGNLQPCPEQYSSFPNRMVFWWFNSLAYLGWKRPLVQEDLWDVNPEDKTKVSVDRLQKFWGREMARMQRSTADYSTPEAARARRKPYEPSLTASLFKTFWLPLLFGGLLKLGNDLVVFAAPQLLRLLIGFITDFSMESWKGYMFAVLLLCSSFLQTMLLGHYFHYSMRIGMQVRSAVTSAVYRKALRITSAAKRSSTVGEMVNLMSVDSQRFMDLTSQLHLIWSAPLQMGLALYFLWGTLGPSVLAGLATMILMVPINAVIGTRSRTLQISQMKEKDGRIKTMTEIMNGMKVLKLYAWEQSFQDQVSGIRDRELDTLKKAAYLSAISFLTFILSPFMVALTTFATYVMVDENNILDAEKAFVSLSLFNILRMPLTMLPQVIISVIQAKVSVDRLSKFLRNDELDPNNVRIVPSSDRTVTSAVSIERGNFAWGKDDSLCLKDIDIDVKEGQLVAVVGQVGTGKSSLMAAMLGLMEKRSGDVSQKGSIAYVSQQAWIQNMTLKQNILFGNPLDERRYQQVIDACALRPDLEMLQGGDQTEIGEKGINLSGGQKQRVSLARAVYCNSDVYVLDDPLSAVDSHVGKHIFDQVIGPNGILKNKTRILVTHGIGFLSQTDNIFVLANGTVSETGSYEQLVHNRGAFANFLRTYLTEDDESLESDDPETASLKQEILTELGTAEIPNGNGPAARAERSMSITSLTSRASMRKIKRLMSRQDSKMPKMTEKEATDAKGPANKGNLVELEKSEIGGVKWNVYWLFLKHMSLPAAMGMILFYIIFNGISVYTNIWLGDWAEDSKDPMRRNSTEWRDFRLGIYGGLGGVQGLFIYFSMLVAAYGQIRASRKLHQNMLARIFRAPMAFFDTTPLGRIINRFSKDIDTVDTALPMLIRMWLNCMFSVIATIVVICIGTPLFASVIVPLGFVYYVIQRFFIASSRQLKRLESVSRSPIYSHFQESVTGTSTIVAMKQSERFIQDNEERVDLNNASYYPNLVSQRWLAVRLESVGNLATFFAALFAVVGRDKDWGVAPKDMGLSISYALTMTQTLNWLVRINGELETSIVSVERIKEYTEVPQEADWIIPESRPEKSWPQRGEIKFDNYQTRYRPELELVLKGVVADIGAGEKIGIVGRTGAGKSSLTLALFRIIEAAGGSIVIDGVKISSMGLHDVRSRITIIPQDPVLFSGTLRLNLDPFKVYSDEEVWRALENAHLKSFVSSLPDGLEHSVAEGGENLSVGQRQLICLARALLRKTKILVLDEATAAIDLETDDLIQATIREKFSDCTILTIAHRLNTIMDSTRIMVLDQGRIKEFDAPTVLSRTEIQFSLDVAKDAGIAS